MRRFVSALAVLIAASTGFAATSSTDPNKTHTKKQTEKGQTTEKAQTHVRTDREVPATPTLKEVHTGASSHEDTTAVESAGSTNEKECPGGGKRVPYHVRHSASARTDFMRASGYPDGRHGYYVSYFTPLDCGGSDTPDNMQWLPIPIKGTTAGSHP
jgi:hypothetical protein